MIGSKREKFRNDTEIKQGHAIILSKLHFLIYLIHFIRNLMIRKLLRKGHGTHSTIDSSSLSS
jgi:hypothetical protein